MDTTQAPPTAEGTQDQKPTEGAQQQTQQGTFTQEQVNQFAGKAREEGRKSAAGELLNQFGVKSLDEIKAILDAKKKQDEEQLSELEKVNKLAAATQAARDALERENKALKLQRAFDQTVQELNLEFVNAKAAADGFSVLDMETIGDGDGMKGAIKKLNEDRPYLFKTAKIPEIDATKKTKGNSQELTDDKKDELRKRFRI